MSHLQHSKMELLPVYFLLTLALISPALTSTHPGAIFADLTKSEVNQVIEFLSGRSELNLVWGDDISIKSSFVQTIEALQPIKSEALDYLDHDGEKPRRSARVIIIRGDKTPPSIEELEVYPIPNPSNLQPLLYSNKRDPIPYHSRIPEIRIIFQQVEEELVILDPYLRTITGYSFANCSTKCLGLGLGGAGNFDGRNRTIVLKVQRELIGRFLQPIGLDVLFELNGQDVSKWKIIWVSYRGRSFNTLQDLMDYFDNLTLKPDPYIPEEDLNSPTSPTFRGEPRPKTFQAGPHQFYPNGPRFQVDGNYVEWLGWSLVVSMPTTTGPRINDVRFLNERILYELSLQEISVFYSGNDAFGSHTNFFDSLAKMGTVSSQLFPGVDCPENAKFIDTVQYHNGKPKTFKNSFCVFEMNKGVPLRRHYAGRHPTNRYFYYHGMPDNVLILRTILTIGNYDYVFDVTLHQGGQIEVRFSLTGFVSGSYYDNGGLEDLYGYPLGVETTLGNIHFHTFHVKVDLDVKGTKNRFRTLNLELHEYPDPLDKSKTLINTRMKEDLKKTEQEAKYMYNFEKPKYLILYNEDHVNRFGKSKGYRIINQAMSKLLLPEQYNGNRAKSWAKYQVAVTRRKDSEPYSGSPYTFMEQLKPVVVFDDFLEDDEDIVDQDLVAWVTLSTHHIPHSEDAPIVTSPGAQLSFLLSPFNYHDEDPSLASRDSVGVVPTGTNGEEDLYYYNSVPGGPHCEKEGVQCAGTVGKVEQKDGELEDDCNFGTTSASGVLTASAIHLIVAAFCISLNFFFH